MDAELEELQYLFDLNGYLVIEDVLSAAEVAELNALIDAQELPAPADNFPRFGSAAGAVRQTGPGFLQWGEPFARLMDHPALLPILRFRLGEAFRLERLYGMYMRKGSPAGRLHADYGASSPNATTGPGEFFAFRDNRMMAGFMVGAWNLRDTGPDVGGFCCIPGSHKSSYRIPRGIHAAHQDSPWVRIVEAPAGSLLVFTEALTHGTARWDGDYERRTLLYKYCVSSMSWGSTRVTPPEGVELSPRQRQLLADPGEPLTHFPSLFSEEFEAAAS
ncbi:MAG: phytanoyl-CoA dioxygenase family protein [Gammaproteobacteria bacterium]|nr:phytanoyl-CoA dioxygenase family protein [Gammaproteobacteria bacterium]